MSEAPETSKIDAVRRAVSQARLADYHPNVMIMHPLDAAQLGICAWPKFRHQHGRFSRMPESRFKKRVMRLWRKGIRNPWKVDKPGRYVWKDEPTEADAQRIHPTVTGPDPMFAPEFERAGGGCVCEACGKLYFDHPMERRPGYLSWDGHPYLNRLCDGRLVKL